MKLNMDLLRDLLIYFEENLPEKEEIEVKKIELKDYSQAEIIFHVKLMAEENLIEYADTSDFSGFDCFIFHLTYSGYEFLSALRNDTVWNKVKETGKDMGVGAIKATIPILVSYVKLQLGLP